MAPLAGPFFANVSLLPVLLASLALVQFALRRLRFHQRRIAAVLHRHLKQPFTDGRVGDLSGQTLRLLSLKPVVFYVAHGHPTNKSAQRSDRHMAPLSSPFPCSALPDRDRACEQHGGRNHERDMRARHERVVPSDQRAEQGNAKHAAGLPLNFTRNERTREALAVR